MDEYKQFQERIAFAKEWLAKAEELSEEDFWASDSAKLEEMLDRLPKEVDRIHKDLASARKNRGVFF